MTWRLAWITAFAVWLALIVGAVCSVTWCWYGLLGLFFVVECVLPDQERQ